MRYTLTLVLIPILTLGYNFSYSQECNIQGTVMDEKKDFLEYANVELYRDSIFQSGTITEENGVFNISNVDCNQNYTIKVRFVGYKVVEKKINISKNTDSQSFELMPDTETLGEVVVTTKKPTIEREADRLIYYTNEGFLKGNNSAYEVLKTAPSVWLDNNGNISINGKRGASVTINSKPVNISGLQLQNYLNGISGKDVLKVEIIAMPGSEFSADSQGGVINIEIKKKFLDGYNARLFTGMEQGKYPEYSTGIFSNYKKGKLTTTANFYIFQKNNFKDNTEIRSSPSNSFNLVSSAYNKLKVNNNQLRLGADYDINENQNINFEHVRTFNQNNEDIDAVSDLSTNSERQQIQGIYDTQSDNIYNGTSLNYRWITDTLGSAFKVLADYVHNDNIVDAIFSSDYLDDNSVFLQNNTTANQLHQLSKIFSGKLDYQHNFKNNHSLQGGVKYSRINVDNDAIEREKIDEEFIVNPLRTNNFTHTESINAAYLNYSGNISKLQYKVGLRVEDAHLTGISEQQTNNIDVRYLDFFPSTFLLWEFGKEDNNALSIAANRKINRPSYEALNSFEYALNEFAISRGNPSLQPEYSTNVELNYSYQNNYSLGLFYTQTKDIMSKVLIANEDITIYETQNISNQNSYGANVNLSFSPIKDKIQTYTYLALTNNQYTSDIVDESLATFYVKINNSLSLPKATKANLSFNYSTKELFGNRIYSPYGQMDFSASKSFLNNKLTINIGINDIFNFQNNNAILIDSPEEIIIKEKYQSRKLQLYIFYNLSTGKSFNKKRIESSDEGEKSRLKN